MLRAQSPSTVYMTIWLERCYRVIHPLLSTWTYDQSDATGSFTLYCICDNMTGVVLRAQSPSTVYMTIWLERCYRVIHPLLSTWTYDQSDATGSFTLYCIYDNMTGVMLRGQSASTVYTTIWLEQCYRVIHPLLYIWLYDRSDATGLFTLYCIYDYMTRAVLQGHGQSPSTVYMYDNMTGAML